MCGSKGKHWLTTLPFYLNNIVLEIYTTGIKKEVFYSLCVCHRKENTPSPSPPPSPRGSCPVHNRFDGGIISPPPPKKIPTFHLLYMSSIGSIINPFPSPSQPRPHLFCLRHGSLTPTPVDHGFLDGRSPCPNFTYPAAVMPLAKSKTLLGPCLKYKVEVCIVK